MGYTDHGGQKLSEQGLGNHAPAFPVILKAKGILEVSNRTSEEEFSDTQLPGRRQPVVFLSQ